MRIVTFAALAVLAASAFMHAQAPSYEATAKVGDLMGNFIGPTNGRLSAMNREGGPQDDRAWAESASAGRALADISQLLLVPSRVKDQPWTEAAQELMASASALEAASVAKNLEEWNTARQQLGQACMTCHQVYRQRPQRGGGARGQ